MRSKMHVRRRDLYKLLFSHREIGLLPEEDKVYASRQLECELLFMNRPAESAREEKELFHVILSDEGERVETYRQKKELAQSFFEFYPLLSYILSSLYHNTMDPLIVLSGFLYLIPKDHFVSDRALTFTAREEVKIALSPILQWSYRGT